ncbi:MAG: hypothetical protein AAGB15_12295 [Pseudomonadota bacterium]
MRNLLTLSATALALSAAAAHADTMSHSITDVIGPQQIVVTGDSNGYKTIAPGPDVKLKAKLTYSTGAVGKIKKWRIDPKMAIDGKALSAYWLTLYGVGHTYPSNDRPKQIAVQRFITIPMDFLDTHVLEACNRRLDLRLNGGMAPHQAYSNGDLIPTDLSIEPSVEATGPGKNVPKIIKESGGTLPFPTIICKPINILHEGPGGKLSQSPNAGASGGGVKIAKPPAKATMAPAARPAAKATLAPAAKPSAALVPAKPAARQTTLRQPAERQPTLRLQAQPASPERSRERE